MAAAELPTFVDGRLYLLRGSTLNALRAALRSTRPRSSPGGGVWVDGTTADGTLLSIDASGQGGGEPGGDAIPDFVDGKLYLLSSQTIAEFENAARRYHARTVEGGGLVIESEGESGVVIGVEEGDED